MAPFGRPRWALLLCSIYDGSERYLSAFDCPTRRLRAIDFGAAGGGEHLSTYHVRDAPSSVCVRR